MNTDEIDEYTGLPKVPEGFFWRIEKFGYSYAKIALRRRRVLGFGSKEIEYEILLNRDPVTIVSDARKILRKMNSQYGEDWSRGLINERRFFGDYPPNSILPTRRTVDYR